MAGVPVYPYGTKVKVDMIGVAGYILSIRITYGTVEYLVTYNMNMVICTQWFNSNEVELCEPAKRTQIGYKQ